MISIFELDLYLMMLNPSVNLNGIDASLQKTESLSLCVDHALQVTQKQTPGKFDNRSILNMEFIN